MTRSLRFPLLATLALAGSACGPPHGGQGTTPPRSEAEAPVDPLRLSLGAPSAPSGELLVRPGQVYDSSAGAAIPESELPGRLAQARVIFVGERHDHLAHRQAQARLLEALSPGAGPLLVGLEMFERRAGVQTVLDAFSRGELEERVFARQADWYSQWGYDFRLYRPIFQVAKRRRLPLVALNVELTVARRLARGGLEALSGAERAALPPLRLSVPRHRSLFRALLGRAHGPGVRQGAPPRPHAGHSHPGSLDRLFAAQVLRDEVMAQTVLKRLEAAGPKARMVVVAGGGHLLFHTGVNARVRLSRPSLGQATVLLVPAPEEGRRVSRAAADFLVGTRLPSLAERALTLGLGLADRADGRPGVKVRRVLPGPARAAGILEGDVIVAVDGDATSTLFALRWALEQRTWGERPVFTVERGGDRQDRVVHLKPEEERPASPPRPRTDLVPVGP